MSAEQHQHAPLFRRLAGNTGYLLLATAVSSAGLFGSQIMAARWLTKELYGDYVFIVSVASFFLYIADLGTSEGTTRLVAALLARGRRAAVGSVALRAAGVALAAGGLAALLMFCGSGLISRRFATAELAPLLALAAAWIVPFALVRVPGAVFEGAQQMRYSFLASLVREPVRLAAFAILGLLGFTLHGAIVGWVLSSLVILVLTGLLFAFFMRRQELALRSGEPWDGPGLLSASKFLYVPYLSVWLLPILLRLMMKGFGSAGQLAEMDLCLTLAALTMMVFMPISQALMPAVSHAHASNLPLVGVAQTFTRLVGLVAFLGLLLYAVAGGRILTLIFGEAYRGAELALVLAVLGVFFDSFKVVTNPLLKGAMQARASTWIDLLRLAVTFGAGVPLTIHYGLTGAMAGFVLGAAVSSVLQFEALWRLLKMDPWREALWPVLWAATLTAGLALGQFWVALALVAVMMAVRPPLRASELKVAWNVLRLKGGAEA